MLKKTKLFTANRLYTRIMASPAKKMRTSTMTPEMTEKCVNTIRVLSADTVEKAKSGHPGAPMGCAPIAHLLFSEMMNFSNVNPKWPNRDRFVLSNGHACALQYSMLHLCGYDLSIDDLKQFRQLGSKTPGHPENGITAGVEVATGPLGQGICNAVGMAIAEAHLAAEYNKDGHEVVNHYTYVICGDGCLQEGVSGEASSLAGHLQLGKLIVCYDDNKITIDGNTALSFTEDVAKRYEAYGWHVVTVADVNDTAQMRKALAEAKSVTNKPSLIKIATVIGHGSAKQGTAGVHGAPLGAADLQNVKKLFGMNPDESFVVPADVKLAYEQVAQRGATEEQAWNKMFAEYTAKHPESAADFMRRLDHTLLAGDWKAKLPVFDPAETKAVATRARSEQVLNAVADIFPEVMGGSADLTPSNLTSLKCSSDFQAATPAGRYIRFGVREHAMAAICNGMYAHGGLRPYCATFLNFMGYALGSFRLSCLSQFGIMYVMTHDSIGLGEDGPTHQPVEMLSTLRSHPNCLVMRPADGNETVGAYIQAMEHTRTPTVMALSRQGVPTLAKSSAEKVALGAYIVSEVGCTEGATPDLIIVATGTEVSMAIDTAAEYNKASSKSVRVISMPCCELFDQQPLSYRLSMFPDNVPVMSVEALSVYGWSKYAHYTVGMTSYGMSAPGEKVYDAFGFTVPKLALRAAEAVEHYHNMKAGCSNMPSLMRLLQSRSVVPANSGH